MVVSIVIVVGSLLVLAIRHRPGAPDDRWGEPPAREEETFEVDDDELVDVDDDGADAGDETAEVDDDDGAALEVAAAEPDGAADGDGAGDGARPAPDA